MVFGKSCNRTEDNETQPPPEAFVDLENEDQRASDIGSPGSKKTNDKDASRPLLDEVTFTGFGTGLEISKYLLGAIDAVGLNNVLQVVTDNAANFKAVCNASVARSIVYLGGLLCYMERSSESSKEYILTFAVEVSLPS
uniref:DUF659 domain-containing protein n=1 Tax=Lactuca sativa TaxID=4236 RepID=A0A9R1VWA1_LACSA|nr:hypothetical protein LSAT_V11C400194870 [Lactuca sativa]